MKTTEMVKASLYGGGGVVKRVKYDLVCCVLPCDTFAVTDFPKDMFTKNTTHKHDQKITIPTVTQDKNN